MPRVVGLVNSRDGQEAEAGRQQAEEERGDDAESLRPQKKKKASNKQGKLLLRELRVLAEVQETES